MPASSPSPSHSYQLTRRRLLTAGAGAAAAFGLVRFAPAASADASTQSYATTDAASDAAVASVDLCRVVEFTPAGQGTTSITVPGGGWYKQGFTNVAEAVYSRTITVPDSGQPQSVWIEFGAVNHQATLSVDGRAVATQTTAFTPSKFDITAYVTPGSTHTISVDVKGRNALKNSSNGRYLVPDAAEWCEAIPQGIYRSAFLRVYPAVYISDTFVRPSVANQALSYDVSVTNTSASARTVTLTGSLSSDNGTSFSYPSLPSKPVAVAAHSTSTVTIGPVAWNLGTTSYWWPNVPYRSGYRAQLHDLAVHAATDDGHTSDATYRFGFREFTQNGAYYYLNGVPGEPARRQPAGRRLRPDQQRRRGRRLRHAARLPAAVEHERRLAAGRGQPPAAELQRGPRPPGAGQPLHARRGRRDGPDDHRRDRDPRLQRPPGLLRRARPTWSTTPAHLVLRDRNHPAVIRWSQVNEPNGSGQRLRPVRAGPVRGDERQRRHPADQRRRRRRRVAEPVPEHDAGQLQPRPALPGRLRQLRRAAVVRDRPTPRRGRVHLAGVQHRARLRMVRHRDRRQARQGRQRPAPLHAAVRLGRLRARRADHRLHHRGRPPPRSTARTTSPTRGATRRSSGSRPHSTRSPRSTCPTGPPPGPRTPTATSRSPRRCPPIPPAAR